MIRKEAAEPNLRGGNCDVLRGCHEFGAVETPPARRKGNKAEKVI